jgi:hypothetical protein
MATTNYCLNASPCRHSVVYGCVIGSQNSLSLIGMVNPS